MAELIRTPPNEATVCVVVDVLRSTTTMVTALANGASAVYPVGDLERAYMLRDELQGSGARVLLGGERDGFPPDGFDIGNSPLDYSGEVVAGRSIVLTTSNGAAVFEALKRAPAVLAAGFVNMHATAEFLLACGGGVVLCCSGKAGRPAREDIVCAGGIIDRLRCADTLLDDPSFVATDLYRMDDADLAAMLSRTEHGRYLTDTGFAADLSAAAAVDAYPIIVSRRADGGFIV